MEDWKKRLVELSFTKGYYFKMGDNGLVEKKDDQLIFTRKELENFISQELDRAREEGEIEVLKDMQKVWDNDNLGDAPKYGSAGAGLMKRWIRDDINERLSKLTTK